MNYQYRPYTPDDFSQLYAIEELSFQLPLRFSRAYMRRLIQNPNSATWVAEASAEENRPMAGFAIVEWEVQAAPPAAYIQTLEVAPEQRRKGVAAELLRRVESSARFAGANSIWLHVDTQNAPAIRLYESGGYQLQGREAHYYPNGNDALIYRKLLPRNL